MIYQSNIRWPTDLAQVLSLVLAAALESAHTMCMRKKLGPTIHRRVYSPKQTASPEQTSLP